MIAALKRMWATKPSAYDVGMSRGLAIAGALGAASHCQEHPWIALMWTTTAALHLYASRSERRTRVQLDLALRGDP